MDNEFEQKRVIFESDDLKQPTQAPEAPTPKMVKWVIKYSGGRIKDQKQAEIALLGLSVLIIIITIVLLFSSRPNINNSQIEELPDQTQFISK